ncbi:hypothetical protein M1843_11345 [Isoptericola sp. 4D.3]|uniref:Lipoprotein n=1 Tax=Isoptericola peretonis TaxID=2918523 RepID=A0ABT0J4D7_9MICO|nr:hypothetical protein [Isoptericola sp. 4D.3]
MTPPRRAGSRALPAAIVAGLLAAVAAGCGPDPVTPDDVDASRLTTLEQAMPVPGEQDPSPARAAAGSANVVAYRASTTSTQPLDALAPESPPAVQYAGAELLAALRDAGWTPAMVSCDAPTDDGAVEAAAVVATRTLDGFTAAARVDVSEDGATTSLYAPFHTEPADPWSADPWNLGPVTGATCLAPDAPAGPGTAGQVPEDLSLGDVLP